MIKQEIEEDRLDNDNEEENPYQGIIINDLLLILTHHKFNNGQYLIMLLTMFIIKGILEIIIN